MAIAEKRNLVSVLSPPECQFESDTVVKSSPTQLRVNYDTDVRIVIIEPLNVGSTWYRPTRPHHIFSPHVEKK